VNINIKIVSHYLHIFIVAVYMYFYLTVIAIYLYIFILDIKYAYIKYENKACFLLITCAYIYFYLMLGNSYFLKVLKKIFKNLT
jgi:hypothetical protein